ncbi:hypothetical protein C0Q70_12432 [Pomacea canaliculata]|uniref:Uncharacterized protein n=1 Tax=Pomacea canaliculata TaxID=400727 RepID=A0A2T7P1H2_POMCA|nr:hypothetical protein C0Q70_12432 [Pomacea canaliculata]
MDGGVLFGMVAAAVLGLSTAQTKHCCTPDQWQGLLTVTTGVTEREHGKLAQSGTFYKLDLETRKCFAIKLSVPFIKFCVPDSAQKLADFTLGAATESLPVSFYTFNKQNTSLQASLTVTRDLCIPVSALEVGEFNRGRDGIMMIMGFVDIQPKISDPSIFDVPRECKDAKPHPEKVMTAMTQARLGKRIDWEDDRGGGDTAQKLGDVTLGANSESLPASVFANIFDDLLVQFTFTQKLCIPVSQLTIANEGPATLVNVAAFANIKTSSPNPQSSLYLLSAKG